MAPGQVTKRTRSQSLIVETTNAVTNTTNNRVVTSTNPIPVSISNVEANHIPSTNQVNQSVPSSMPADASFAGGSSSKKPCRGPTRGIGLVKRNGVAGNKLKVVIDVEHGRPLNRIQSAKLSNELGQIARDYMPCPIKYSKFTEEEKNRAWERLLMRLDVVNFREDPRVFQCVENIFKVRYRNYKHELHKEFMEYNSTTEAKLHVPKGLQSRSSRANTFHLEEQMKANMTENSQLKNEVEELKMKFQQYEELLAALAAERSTQD